jgi:hypothetical protein
MIPSWSDVPTQSLRSSVLERRARFDLRSRRRWNDAGDDGHRHDNGDRGAQRDGIERRNAEQQMAQPKRGGHGQRESRRHARGVQVETLSNGFATIATEFQTSSTSALTAIFPQRDRPSRSCSSSRARPSSQWTRHAPGSVRTTGCWPSWNRSDAHGCASARRSLLSPFDAVEGRLARLCPRFRDVRLQRTFGMWTFENSAERARQ